MWLENSPGTTWVDASVGSMEKLLLMLCLYRVIESFQRQKISKNIKQECFPKLKIIWFCNALVKTQLSSQNITRTWQFQLNANSHYIYRLMSMAHYSLYIIIYPCSEFQCWYSHWSWCMQVYSLVACMFTYAHDLTVTPNNPCYNYSFTRAIAIEF